MELKTLLYEKESGIGVVTLNRPTVFNAMSVELLDELACLMAHIDADDEIKCVIITGGSKAFAAGADIAYMSKVNAVEAEIIMSKFHKAFNAVADLSKPAIAAIAGLALGGGCELALACDIRIAAEGSKMGLPETNLGIFPGGGGTQRLARVVGLGWAKDMILTGDPIDTETAKKIGLVTRVVPADALIEEAKKLASKLAAKAPITTKLLKLNLNNAANTDLTTGLLFEQKTAALLFATEDSIEGLNAFVNKSKPNFKGC